MVPWPRNSSYNEERPHKSPWGPWEIKRNLWIGLSILLIEGLSVPVLDTRENHRDRETDNSDMWDFSSSSHSLWPEMYFPFPFLLWWPYQVASTLESLWPSQPKVIPPFFEFQKHSWLEFPISVLHTVFYDYFLLLFLTSSPHCPRISTFPLEWHWYPYKESFDGP